jgi:hypothetical protein
VDAIVARIRLVLRLLAATFAFLVYVWIAAVRLTPAVKRRRRALRGADPRARRRLRRNA